MEMLKERNETWKDAQSAEGTVSNGDGPEAFTVFSSATNAGHAGKPIKKLTVGSYIAAIDADLRIIADTIAEIWAELEELQRITQ